MNFEKPHSESSNLPIIYLPKCYAIGVIPSLKTWLPVGFLAPCGEPGESAKLRGLCGRMAGAPTPAVLWSTDGVLALPYFRSGHKPRF